MVAMETYCHSLNGGHGVYVPQALLDQFQTHFTKILPGCSERPNRLTVLILDSLKLGRLKADQVLTYRFVLDSLKHGRLKADQVLTYSFGLDNLKHGRLKADQVLTYNFGKL